MGRKSKTENNGRTNKKNIKVKDVKTPRQKGRQRKTNTKQRISQIKLSRQDSSCTANATCLENAMSYLKIMKDDVGNYIRQDKRLRAANKTGGKKSGKKGLFKTVLHRILEAGGGNKSQLTCSGSSTSDGAKKLTELSNALINCEKNINASCNPANFPTPNITQIDICLGDMETFKSMVDNCMTKTGSSACDCWSNSTFSDIVAKVKACKLSTESKAMVAQLSECKGKFSTCKGLEDDSLKAISACSVPTSSLVAKAAALTANSLGLTAANTTASSLAASSSRRVRRAKATTCAEVIAIISKMLAAANEAAASPLVAALAVDITNVIGITCDDDEKATLTTQVGEITIVTVEITETLDSIQADLLTATGSTASPEVISAATPPNTVTAASGGRMRQIAARHLMNKLNLKEFRGRN